MQLSPVFSTWWLWDTSCGSQHCIDREYVHHLRMLHGTALERHSQKRLALRFQSSAAE